MYDCASRDQELEGFAVRFLCLSFLLRPTDPCNCSSDARSDRRNSDPQRNDAEDVHDADEGQ
jgi:hypothetical protein